MGEEELENGPENEEEEIDITALPTDELLELMGEDLYDGYADEVAHLYKDLDLRRNF